VKKKTCKHEGCKNIAQKGGVCIKHGAKVKTCSQEGCTNRTQAGGVCVKHGAVVAAMRRDEERLEDKAKLIKRFYSDAEYDKSSSSADQVFASVDMHNKRPKTCWQSFHKFLHDVHAGHHSIMEDENELFDLAKFKIDFSGFYETLMPDEKEFLERCDGKHCLTPEAYLSAKARAFSPHLNREENKRLATQRPNLCEHCYVGVDPPERVMTHQGKSDRTHVYDWNKKYGDRFDLYGVDHKDMKYFVRVGEDGTNGCTKLGKSHLPVPIKYAYRININGPHIHKATFIKYFDNYEMLPQDQWTYHTWDEVANHDD